MAQRPIVAAMATVITGMAKGRRRVMRSH